MDFDILNVTVGFSGTDERRLLPLQIIDDEVGEGDETILLSLAAPSMLEGVVTGVNATTEVTIVEDDCKSNLYLFHYIHSSIILSNLYYTYDISHWIQVYTDKLQLHGG